MLSEVIGDWIYCLTFVFNEKKCSPPLGSYTSEPDQELPFPQDKISSIVFKTWNDSYNFSLNCIEFMDESGSKISELGADSVLEHHSTEVINFRANDKIVAIKVETSGNWAA